MNPEHRLLKFVIVPLILILFAGFVFWHFNQGAQWNEVGPYYSIDNYQGDRTFSLTNVSDYLDKTWDNDDLKYVVSIWHQGKSYFFNKQSDDGDKIDSNSRFRVASISKVFTSIAMLQLVEKGVVSLDDKVEKYVHYRKNFKEQPTVGHLLLHTAGFDNNNTSFFFERRMDKPALKDFLFRQELVQAVEPCKVVDYTNTAFDIAGYIIEQVSGQRFEDYCRENIFQPLGMDNTSFDEPQSYVLGMDNKNETVENYFVGGRPSGGLVSTSNDMYRFLDCVMQNGKLEGKTVFSQKLMNMVFEKRLELDQRLPLKKTPVFWIDKLDQMDCFGQMGKILGFSSHIIVIPGQVALFCAAANESTGQHIGWSLVNTFFKETTDNNSLSVVFSRPEPEMPNETMVNINTFSGRWINMFGWNRNNVAKLANAVAFNLDVRVVNGKLWIDDVQMERVDDLTFRNDAWHVKFIRGEDGELKYLQTGQDAHIKSSWYNDSGFLKPYLIVTFVLFVLGLLQSVFGFLMRHWGREKPMHDENVFWWSMFAVSLLHLCFVSVCCLILTTVDIYRLGFKPGIVWYVIFSMPVVAIAGTLPVLALMPRMLGKGRMTVTAKINALMIMLSQVGFAIFLVFWNLVGFRF